MNIEAFFKITYGLYVISSRLGDKINGYISNTVFQVTAEPAQIAISCSKDNFTSGLITESKAFSISVLEEDVPSNVMGTFGYKSGRDINKFEGFNYLTGQTGSPVLLDNTIAWFECKVVNIIDSGTHIIFIGELVNNDLIFPDKKPLTYNYYREVKKGKAPKNAPTFIDEKKISKPDVKAKKYVCPACGYVYEPVVGDPENGFPPGTLFEDLPDTWICPICGTEKADFIELR